MTVATILFVTQATLNGIGSPPPRDSVETLRLVERAAATSLKGRHPKQTVAFVNTPHEFGTMHEPTGPDTAIYRTPDHLQTLAKLMDAILVVGLPVPGCNQSPVNGCPEVFVRIGVPVVSGDSATVWVYEWESIEGGSASEESDTNFLVRMRDGIWVVERPLESKRTYSIKP